MRLPAIVHIVAAMACLFPSAVLAQPPGFSMPASPGLGLPDLGLGDRAPRDLAPPPRLDQNPGAKPQQNPPITLLPNDRRDLLAKPDGMQTWRRAIEDRWQQLQPGLDAELRARIVDEQLKSDIEGTRRTIRTRHPETEQVPPDGVGNDLADITAAPSAPAIKPQPPAVDDGPQLVAAAALPTSTTQPRSAVAAQERDAAGIQACDAAKHKLQYLLYTAVGGKPPSWSKLLERATDPADRDALEAHDKACLAQLGAATDAATEEGRIARLIAPLLPRVGVLVFTGDAAGILANHVLCTGLLLDRTFIATGRHCLYDHTDTATPKRIQVKFARWSAPDTLLDVAETPIENPDYQAAPYRDAQRSGDFALLRLRRPLDDAVLAQPLAVAAPATFQRITLVGVQTLLGFARTKQSPTAGLRQNWTPLMRYEVRADCRIGWVSPKGCFFYACNPEGGWSGGPILAVRDDESGQPTAPVLLGVHTGAVANYASAAEQTDCGLTGAQGALRPSFINIGAPVPGWIARR